MHAASEGVGAFKPTCDERRPAGVDLSAVDGKKPCHSALNYWIAWGLRRRRKAKGDPARLETRGFSSRCNLFATPIRSAMV